jgi:hypothetical protein
MLAMIPDEYRSDDDRFIAHTDVVNREAFFVGNGVNSLRMMAFLFAWLFSIISAIFMLYSPECCAGTPAIVR